MNKQIFNACFGFTVALSTMWCTSCNNDEIDDLKSKVAVIENAIDDIKKQLENAIISGQTITNVNQDPQTGEWTITLSNNQVIQLGTGESNDINVVVTESEAIISIDGQEYKLPLGSSITSFIYSPTTVDGIVDLGNEGVDVYFLVRPSLNSIDGAEFSIAESHQVLSRAGDGEQFKVTGATLEGDFIKVHIKGLDVIANNCYAVSLQMNYKGTIIGSNFFNIQIKDDFTFKTEELVKPVFADNITDATLISGKDNVWTATLPDNADFAGTFDFKQLASLPSIEEAGETSNVVFTLGKIEEQNTNVKANYDLFKICLSEDGVWTMSDRPGTNCSKAINDANPDGLLIYMKVDDVIKSKIYWKINDPLSGANFSSIFSGKLQGHFEYGEAPTDGSAEGQPIMLNIGANNVNMVEALVSKKFSLIHTNTNADELLETIDGLTINFNEEPVLYVDGTTFKVNEDFKNKYAKKSRGLVWYSNTASIASSLRKNWTNLTEDEKKQYTGALIPGWDNINKSMMEEMGITVSPNGELITTSEYGGWAIRIPLGVEFEYDYGKIPVSNGILAYIWFNRRTCPEGVTDPKAK